MSIITYNRNFRTTLVFISIGLLAGLIYPLLGREYYDPIALLNGLIIGLIGSLFLSTMELYPKSPLKKRMKFIPQVIVKTVFYTSFFVMLILVVYSVNRSLFAGTKYLEYLKGPEFSTFVFEGDFNIIVGYTLIISAAIIFTHQMSSKMGQGMMLNLIFGKYHHPKNEHRIFMFLDLNDSTSLAEKMGEIKYNQFVNEFFQDITEPIIQYYGLIYRYVGDEMVVTWPLSSGLRNINCMRAFYQANAAISGYREKYLDKYKVVPSFSAGFHDGAVVIGQLGDVKSQLVFSGKVLYDGAKIEKYCRKLGHDHLISHSLIQQLEIPKYFQKVYVGEVKLDEKNETKLYTIKTREF